MLTCAGASGVEGQQIASHVGVEPGVGGCATQEGKQSMQAIFLCVALKPIQELTL